MSLWQTQSWQEMLINSGQTQEYFVIEIDFQSEKKQKIFVEKRKVSLGEYGLFVIGFEGIIDEKITDHLKELCIEENCLFAQIETLDYDSAASFLPLGENCMRADARKSGIGDFKVGKYYKKFIPSYTAVIDLTQSEEKILEAMKQKGRYNIKVAQKSGVEVKQVWKTPENIQKFHDLMQKTTQRNNFFGNSLSYYQKFLELEGSLLFFAEYQNEVLAAGIFVSYEDIFYYYYGASSNHKQSFMAPYLLQWTVIQYAKTHKKTLYDFLGIADPSAPVSALKGVTDFKLKFTPDTRHVSQSFLFIHKKWKYSVIQVLKKVRKK